MRKIRITGGEPLIRRDLERLVEMIAVIEGIEDISMTTKRVDVDGRAGPVTACCRP